jgi:hypothetical protein
MATQSDTIQKGFNYDDGFSIMPKELAQDHCLSLEALGLATYFLSLPDDWKITFKNVQKAWNIGRDKLYRILNELIASGYVSRISYINQHGQKRWKPYTFYASPSRNPHHKAVENDPCPEKPHTENKDVITTKERFKKEKDLADPLQSAQSSSGISEIDLTETATKQNKDAINLCMDELPLYVKKYLMEAKQVRWVSWLTWQNRGISAAMFDVLYNCGAIEDERSVAKKEKFTVNNSSRYRLNAEWLAAFKLEFAKEQAQSEDIAIESQESVTPVTKPQSQGGIVDTVELDIAPQSIKTLDDLDVRLRVALEKLNRRWRNVARLTSSHIGIGESQISDLFDLGLIENRTMGNGSIQYRISEAGKALLNPSKSKKPKVKLRNDKLVLMLGSAMSLTSEPIEPVGRDYGNYVKIAKEIYTGIIGNLDDLNDDNLDSIDWNHIKKEFAAFVQSVRRDAKNQGNWKVTINSLIYNGRMTDYVTMRDSGRAQVDPNAPFKIIVG